MRDTPGSSHPPGTRPEPYHEPVTLSVRDVAAVIRDRKPGTLSLIRNSGHRVRDLQ